MYLDIHVKKKNKNSGYNSVHPNAEYNNTKYNSLRLKHKLL